MTEIINQTSGDVASTNENKKQHILIIILLSLLSGLIAKLPFILNVREDFYYSRNIGFIVFTGLIIYFSWFINKSIKKTITSLILLIITCIYINLSPDLDQSDTVIIVRFHTIIFLIGILTYAYTSKNNIKTSISLIKYLSDLFIMQGILLFFGAVLSAITIGLFELIGLNITEFYIQNIALWGLSALPMVSTYIISTNQNLVSKISPLIAKIFSPLVLLMLSIYLFTILYIGKDPYRDREFLFIFNIVIAGVLCLIFFSVNESEKSKFSNWVLFLLSSITIILTVIALSAIIYRINEWGFTANRTTLLGSNILMLINLILVNIKLFKSLNMKNSEDEMVTKMIIDYLPVYYIWALIVMIFFPLIFGY